MPDPALLDGSTHPAEKRPDHGMIGEFEMPGDENVGSGRVGASPIQISTGGRRIGTGKQSGLGLPVPLGGGLPSAGSPGLGLPGIGVPGIGAPSVGVPGIGLPPAGVGREGAAPALPTISTGTAGGIDAGSTAGNPIASGDGSTQPAGMQVSELGGSGGGESGGGGDQPLSRPPPITIGDKAMRIEGAAGAAPSTVGQKVADGHIQQHEKATGTGGKPPATPQGPGRVEKGRTIPAGL